jgi:hypothetical protein
VSYQKLVTDIVKLVTDATPLPAAGDRSAVKAFLTKLIPDLVDLVYDAGGLDAVKALCASPEPFEKIGDGKILQWVTTNLPTIISLVETILAIIPK